MTSRQQSRVIEGIEEYKQRHYERFSVEYIKLLMMHHIYHVEHLEKIHVSISKITRSRGLEILQLSTASLNSSPLNGTTPSLFFMRLKRACDKALVKISEV